MKRQRLLCVFRMERAYSNGKTFSCLPTPATRRRRASDEPYAQANVPRGITIGSSLKDVEDATAGFRNGNVVSLSFPLPMMRMAGIYFELYDDMVQSAMALCCEQAAQ